jgi:hypothetical protein
LCRFAARLSLYLLGFAGEGLRSRVPELSLRLPPDPLCQ